MACKKNKNKKFQKGVNLTNPLGDLSSIFGDKVKNTKTAKYGQIASNLTSIAGSIGGGGETRGLGNNIATTNAPKNTAPENNVLNNENITSDDIYGKYGMNVGEALARRGMRVKNRKKKKNK